MGCTCSRPQTEGENPRIFRVVNVDDHGVERNPGKIEITETELIWYQRGKEPIHWPLRSLRRYGFDAELFSFESGRRCPTGPGIYAFRCRRAEALFNLLQECIQRQRVGHPEDSQRSLTSVSTPLIMPTADHSSSRPSMGIELQTFSEPYADSPQLNGDLQHVQGHEYVNTGEMLPNSVAQGSVDFTGVVLSQGGVLAQGSLPQEHVIQYAELDLPRPGEEGDSDSRKASCDGTSISGLTNGDLLVLNPSSSQATYINVPAGEIKTCAVNGVKANGSNQVGLTADSVAASRCGEDPHAYANLGVWALSGSGASSSDSQAQTSQEPTVPKVNYIQLDLKSSSDSVQYGVCTSSTISASSTVAQLQPAPSAAAFSQQHPESPTRKTEGYAIIDFDRTHALNMNTKNSVTVAEEEGTTRKTRHNSNISELY